MLEQRAQFALWCIQASPLILGHDVTKMGPVVKAIITNKEMIALDQDPLGEPARIAFQTSGKGGSHHPHSLLEARDCNASDAFQQWTGAALRGAGGPGSPLASVGAGACLGTKWADPVTVGSCDAAAGATVFLARAAAASSDVGPSSITLEVASGDGDGGYAGRCLDVNHGS